MKEQLQKSVTSFGEAINGYLTFQSQKQLLEVNENSKQLDKKESDIFIQ